jgi:hypothetical protein
MGLAGWVICSISLKNNNNSFFLKTCVEKVFSHGFGFSFNSSKRLFLYFVFVSTHV